MQTLHSTFDTLSPIDCVSMHFITMSNKIEVNSIETLVGIPLCLAAIRRVKQGENMKNVVPLRPNWLRAPLNISAIFASMAIVISMESALKARNHSFWSIQYDSIQCGYVAFTFFRHIFGELYLQYLQYLFV